MTDFQNCPHCNGGLEYAQWYENRLECWFCGAVLRSEVSDRLERARQSATAIRRHWDHKKTEAREAYRKGVLRT